MHKYLSRRDSRSFRDVEDLEKREREFLKDSIKGIFFAPIKV